MSDDAAHQSHVQNVALEAEDLARADLYALLGSLFYAPPPKEILSNIAANAVLCNDESVTDFCHAWRALQQAAAQTDAEAVKDEFETAFIGTGRQPVMLYRLVYESDSCTRSHWCCCAKTSRRWELRGAATGTNRRIMCQRYAT